MKHSVAIADSGRRGEIRFLGEVSSSPAVVARLLDKLAGRWLAGQTFEHPAQQVVFQDAIDAIE